MTNVLAPLSLSWPLVNEQTAMLASPDPVVKASKENSGLFALYRMAVCIVRCEVECPKDFMVG